MGYFTGNDSDQYFLAFALMLNPLMLDNDKKVANLISAGVSLKKIKLLNVNFAPTMTNLANGRVSIKCNNSVLVQRGSFSLYSNLVLNFIHTL